MLTSYLSATERLLQNPAAPEPLYSAADLTVYINTARGQLAGEGECIRFIATLSTVVGQRAYDFSALNTGTSSANGIQGIINVRQMWYGVGTGMRWIPTRPWEWFSLYYLNNPVPVNGAPTAWSQFGQGAAPGATGSNAGGSFYIDPPPDTVYTLSCDCVCYPIPLVDDLTKESIPYLWTDAVPWYAAAYALWSSQTNARASDAERYFNTYTKFVERARVAANPSVGRWQYSQAADAVQPQKIAFKSPAAGQGAG